MFSNKAQYKIMPGALWTVKASKRDKVLSKVDAESEEVDEYEEEADDDSEDEYTGGDNEVMDTTVPHVQEVPPVQEVPQAQEVPQVSQDQEVPPVQEVPQIQEEIRPANAQGYRIDSINGIDKSKDIVVSLTLPKITINGKTIIDPLKELPYIGLIGTEQYNPQLFYFGSSILKETDTIPSNQIFACYVGDEENVNNPDYDMDKYLKDNGNQEYNITNARQARSSYLVPSLLKSTIYYFIPEENVQVVTYSNVKTGMLGFGKKTITYDNKIKILPNVVSEIKQHIKSHDVKYLGDDYKDETENPNIYSLATRIAEVCARDNVDTVYIQKLIITTPKIGGATRKTGRRNSRKSKTTKKKKTSRRKTVKSGTVKSGTVKSGTIKSGMVKN
jgi:hypothetical protein